MVFITKQKEPYVQCKHLFIQLLLLRWWLVLSQEPVGAAWCCSSATGVLHSYVSSDISGTRWLQSPSVSWLWSFAAESFYCLTSSAFWLGILCISHDPPVKFFKRLWYSPHFASSLWIRPQVFKSSRTSSLESDFIYAKWSINWFIC